jgi:hypothetical protein
MTAEELLDLWTPDHIEWCRWTKPIAFLGDKPQPLWNERELVSDVDISWAGKASDALVVLDLPGVLSVRTGIALAKLGYWPIPLFNASQSAAKCTIEMDAIRLELWRSAEALRSAEHRPQSPPVFLLDSQRMAAVAKPGEFDNRWMTFPQDFPSANLLLARGIRRAILCLERSSVSEDLAHVVRRWQDAGIALIARVGSHPLTPLHVRPPRRFRHWWYTVLALLRLRENSAGSFGSIVPYPSEGGHGFG